MQTTDATGKNWERRLQWHREQTFNQKLSNGKEHKTAVKSSVILQERLIQDGQN